jgi:DNA-directed RNA polymerase specialized sigma24 family protein
VEKDAEFRAASAMARETLIGDALSLAAKQTAFLEACNESPTSGATREPRQPRASYPTAYEVASLRETHAKAYAPWTTVEENDLVLRHQQGESVDAIAARLGRKPGAIRSRLKKLALI